MVRKNAATRDPRLPALPRPAPRYATFPPHADTIYQCDDKCGSFWQKLPVDPSSRDTKENVKAKYSFAVQSNVVVGPKGVMRFTVVPKNVPTGANFGLTNFVSVLHRAWQKGRLGPHVQKAIRHTDGGPDNVAWPSHVLHFLLVYIGAFNVFTWFRFMPGHSHTELSDRYFAFMKKLFDSDGSARVGGVQDFVELEQRLHDLFARAKEDVELRYLFASWDFAKWFADLDLQPEEDFGG